VDDPTAELKGARLKRDNSDLKKVIRQIQDTCDPFTSQVVESSKLFNISTGKAAAEETKASLLSIKEKGKAKKEEFTTTCFEDPGRFKSALTKVPLKTFKNESVRNKRTTDKRVAALTCSRNLLGRLLILACRRDLDLKHVLSFPLTPVSLLMCSVDGLMMKTQKSALFELLEKKAPQNPSLRSVDACVIDRNFLLHTLPPHLPATYGGLASGILQQVTAYSQRRIDIVFRRLPDTLNQRKWP
jgi:hypothetical protein